MLESLAEFFDTAGVGLFLVGGIVTFLLTAYGLTTIWISKGQVDESEKKES
jgi:hypothetical protein